MIVLTGSDGTIRDKYFGGKIESIHLIFIMLEVTIIKISGGECGVYDNLCIIIIVLEFSEKMA